MRRFATLISVVVCVGCGDEPLCGSDVVVVIQSPTSSVVDDDPMTDGTQADVTVRTNLAGGEVVHLAMFDTKGAAVGDALDQPVDDDGTALFHQVTVPATTSMLQATGTGRCGENVDAVSVNVQTDRSVTVSVVEPVIGCGAQITPADDADLATPGVQLVVRVTAPAAAQRFLEITDDAGVANVDASQDVTRTMLPGGSELVGIGKDEEGNATRSAACTITLVDLAVSFAAPAADGLVSARDGVVAGDQLTFPLCGTVSRPGATLDVSVDGMPAAPAVVNGTGWCRTITLAESPPTHTLVATAHESASVGSSTLVLGVDLTPPSPISDLDAVTENRQKINIRWDAPDDQGATVDHYILKFASVPITEANFDTVGTVIPTQPPQAPGTLEMATLFPARTGSPTWIAIASGDAAGNRSTAAVVGPRTPVFTQTGAILSPFQNQGMLELGAAMVHGRFNDDDFDDVAVSAPFQVVPGKNNVGVVYIYFGGPGGIPATPSLTISGATVNGKLGTSLAAVRWSSATRDDLVIGEPGGDANGRLWIFHGGATFGSGTRVLTTAEQRITVNATTPGWFAASQLGFAMTAGDVDGDSIDDLVIGAPAGGGMGGFVTLYGGTVTGDVALSDVDPSGLDGAIAEYMPDPAAVPGHQYGFYVHAIGHTTGIGTSIAAGYLDDLNTAGDSVYVLRGDGTRPASGIALRSFVAGRDVRLDYVTISKLAEWGSQVTTIEDQNGDGVRELVMSAYRAGSGTGQVLVVDGAAFGTSGVARTSDPGVVLTTIQGGIGMRLGAVIAAHDARSHPDVDGDGKEDLVVGGVVGNVARLFVWFGGSIPTGATTVATAGYTITGPTTFLLTTARPEGPAGVARWIGDVNGDGLDDLCWTSPYDSANNVDGGFEVLWDGPIP